MQGSKRDIDIKNRLLHTVGEGKGGMTGENSTETYTVPYVKHIASGSLMYDAGSPKPVLCDNLKGGRGREAGEGYKREGTYVYLWLIHVDIWQNLSQSGKVIIL